MTLAQELDQLIPQGESRKFGELVLSRSDAGTFTAMHRTDAMMNGSLESLDSIQSASELRELSRHDTEGNYRPLKTAPTLIHGWQTSSDCAEEFLSRLDAIYPAVFATWVEYQKGTAPPVPLQETLSRQSGIYKNASGITDQNANQIMRDTCSLGCIRKIAWPINDHCTVSKLKALPREIPVVCVEACSLAISEAASLANGSD
tara:strand:+ start:4919 stop:5527 length:609 start_codon:yes stop_codon:yes gene_type:complete